jgi:dipeptidyl aminopeptidase/acylaminoacyl peptidase
MPDELLDIERLVRVPAVLDSSAGYAVAPDGRTVAVAWNQSGQWELYLLAFDGQEAPRQITPATVPDSKIAPSWSPDGRRLAYIQDHDGDERYDIYIYDLESGQHCNVTPDTPEYLAPGFDWSPDGARLVVSATREGRFGIWTLPVAGGEWTRISNHSHSDDEPRWSPRGDLIAFVANTAGQHYSLFLARPDGGEVREARLPGGAQLFAQSPAWSPDGTRLAFVGGPRDTVDIGIYHVATGAIDWVEQGQHECAAPSWSPDGARLAYGVNDGGDLRLLVADLASGARHDLSLGAGVHEAPCWTAHGRGVLFAYSGPGHPPDLWLAELEGAQPSYRQLTRSLPDELADRAFVAPIHIGYPSLADRQIVPALLYVPRNSPRGRKHPLVVQIHGGPAWQRMNTWYPEIQWLLAHGCVVLCPNYRGSTGYGRAYMEANRFVMGDADLKDVVGGIDWVAEHMAGVDTSRVAVTGWSYGGYLTMMCLTKYPERFVAGSAGWPFLNWVLAADEERDDLRHWDRENMGDPLKDAERLHAASPIHFMDRISAAVQFIGGATDPRCPISQVHEAQAVMERLGKPFELVIYPDEGHGFLKIENHVDAERRWAAFLAKSLGI